MSGYREVATKIRDLIEAGEYLPGDTLPRQDDIADMHDVNIHTVRKAVDLLASEGYVRPIRRRGTVVLDRARVVAAVGELRERLAAWDEQQGPGPHVLVSPVDLRIVLDAVNQSSPVPDGDA